MLTKEQEQRFNWKCHYYNCAGNVRPKQDRLLKLAFSSLNALRVSRGMKPLKSWKRSKAKLTEAIAKLSS